MTPQSTTLPTNRIWLGSLLALLSALAFSFNLVLAGLSYQYGANIHALNLTRALGFFLVLGVIVLSTSVSLALPSKIRMASSLVGVFLCLEMYAMLGAIQTIPVALAVLIFYTYPLIIAIYRWLKGSDKFSITSLILLLAAFGGIVIVLMDSSATLDFNGIVYSAIAAIVMALMLITSEHSLVNHDNYVVLLHSLAVVTLVVFVLSITSLELHWPEQPAGWLAFAGSGVFYVVATLFLFKAVSLIGPLKTAIIDNTAPVWAIVFGYFLLQQILTLQQIFGAIVVIAAVIALQLVTSKL